MKFFLRLLGLVFTLLIVVVAIERIASESGEVVVVGTKDAQGHEYETRLWIVEHNGSDWIRSGSEMSGWYRRLVANPAITIKRGDTAYTANAIVSRSAVPEVNKQMNEKYGWADDYIGMLFGREDSIAIRLDR